MPKMEARSALDETKTAPTMVNPPTHPAYLRVLFLS